MNINDSSEKFILYESLWILIYDHIYIASFTCSLNFCLFLSCRAKLRHWWRSASSTACGIVVGSCVSRVLGVAGIWPCWEMLSSAATVSYCRLLMPTATLVLFLVLLSEAKNGGRKSNICTGRIKGTQFQNESTTPWNSRFWGRGNSLAVSRFWNSQSWTTTNIVMGVSTWD